jgi:hypothetical protein
MNSQQKMSMDLHLLPIRIGWKVSILICFCLLYSMPFDDSVNHRYLARMGFLREIMIFYIFRLILKFKAEILWSHFLRKIIKNVIIPDVLFLPGNIQAFKSGA